MVFLDSARAGETPIAIDGVVPGVHSLALTADGYRWSRQQINVQKNNQRFKIRLDRETSATLVVDTEPQRVDVTVDGVYRGRTPLVVSDLTPGDHEVVLAKTGYAAISETIPLTAYGATRLRRALKSKIESYYAQAIQENPTSLHNYTELLHHQVVEGEFAVARKTLRQALQVIGEHSALKADEKRRFYQELWKIYRAQFEYGDIENIACMRKAIEDALLDSVRTYPNVVENQKLLLGIYHHRKDMNRLMEILASVAQKAPNNMEVLKVIAETYRRTRQYDKALQVLQRVVKRAPDDAQARMSLARVAMMKGNYDLACGQIEHLLKRKKMDRREELRARMMLAHIYRRKKDYNKAAEQYQALLKQEQKPEIQCMLLFNMASLYAKAGEDSKARELYNQVLSKMHSNNMRAESFIRKRIELRLNSLLQGSRPKRYHRKWRLEKELADQKPPVIRVKENPNP